MELKQMLRLPLLASLGEETLCGLLASGQVWVKACRKGQLLHAEGEICAALEVILSGSLAVERLTPEGDLMSVASFGAGDCVGGNLLFSADPVHHLAVSVAQAATILSIQKDCLVSLLLSNRGFLLKYLGYVADNAVLLEGQLTYFANLPIKSRVINYLNAQQRMQGESRVPVPFGKKALAARLGVHRSSLSRCLQQMKRDGILDFDRGSITLKQQ